MAAAASKIRLGRKWRGWSWRSNELPRSFAEEWKLSSPIVGTAERSYPLLFPRLHPLRISPTAIPRLAQQSATPFCARAPPIKPKVPRNKTCFRQAGNFICLRCACSRKRTKDTSESRFNRIDRPCLIVDASGTCRRTAEVCSLLENSFGKLFHRITHARVNNSVTVIAKGIKFCHWFLYLRVPLGVRDLKNHKLVVVLLFLNQKSDGFIINKVLLLF